MPDPASPTTPPTTDAPDVAPYALGMARARRELISGRVSTEVAASLLALLGALDLAADLARGGPTDDPSNYLVRRLMFELIDLGTDPDLDLDLDLELEGELPYLMADDDDGEGTCQDPAVEL